MKMKNIIILFVLSMIVLSSCSDDKTPTDPGTDVNSVLLPSTVGTYWIGTFVSTTLPPNVVPDETTRYIDSTIVSGNGIYQGKQATELTSYIDGSPIEEPSYIYQTSTELHQYSSAFSTPFFSFPKSWIKIVDYNATTWKPFPDTSITNYSTVLFSEPATLDGTIKSNTERSGTNSVQVDGKLYTTTTFTTTVKFDLVAKPIALTILIPIKFDVVSTINHVKGLGFVSSETNGYNINVPYMGGNVTEKGNLYSLLRFKINP